MKLATIRRGDGTLTTAAIVGEEAVDLCAVDAALPPEMTQLLVVLDHDRGRVRAAAESGQGRLPLGSVTVEAPVQRPGKFLAVGLNYADHIAETGAAVPDYPTVFAKASTSVNGPYADVLRPADSEELDFEGELGFVIGRRCRHVRRGQAADVIAGYVIINDYSVRDIQLRTSQWTLGKSFDTHGVVGPWIVTGDELDPRSLALRTLVNGELRQSSNTSNLIFDSHAQVEIISSICTLEPGDVIATGTPGGVGMATGRYLAAGDVVRVEIDGIGAIENRVVQEVRQPVGAEPAPTS
jgi:2-keto-4-pentenoate hydratase/2-oxohepta-3-ene-1,7-dioic acid hydratase in catechol pathway